MENDSFRGSSTTLKRIRINNFRSIVMNDFIQVKPITLLFGKNGSGKSSFLKAIKFVGNNLFPVGVGETKYREPDKFDLGSFNDIVLNNDINKKVEIEYGEYSVTNITNEDDYLLDTQITDYIVSTVFTYNDKNQNLSTIQLSDLNKKFELKILPQIKNQFDEDFVKSASSLRISSDMRELLKAQGEAGYPNKSISVYREANNLDDILEEKIIKFIKYVDLLPFIDLRPDLRLTYFNQLAKKIDLGPNKNEFINYWINHLLTKIPLQTNMFFNPLYITPFRERPKSEYTLKNNKFDPMEYFGVLRILDDEIENFNPFNTFNSKGDGDRNRMDFINSAIEQLTLGKQIEILKSEGRGKVILTDMNNNKVNLSESSSGLLHILPIIFASSLSSYNNESAVWFSNDPEFSDVVMIEQPELHLHPALQTKLIEFLCKAYGITYIIETHSEHMVRKLQVMIAKGELDKENVGVYYFDKDKETGVTSIKELEMEENGFFKEPWPDDFFDDSYNLARELIYARKN